MEVELCSAPKAVQSGQGRRNMAILPLLGRARRNFPLGGKGPPDRQASTPNQPAGLLGQGRRNTLVTFQQSALSGASSEGVPAAHVDRRDAWRSERAWF